MSVVDDRCADVFQNMHPEVILNFEPYNSVISVGIFWFGWCSANTQSQGIYMISTLLLKQQQTRSDHAELGENCWMCRLAI